MFAPLDGIPEAPSIGSAAPPLAVLLCTDRGENQSLTIHQGYDMGGLSQIHLKAEPGKVTVAGSVVPVMSGKLIL